MDVLARWKSDPSIPVVDFRGAGSRFGVIVDDRFSLFQPLLKHFPVDFVSDPLFTKKLYVTALIALSGRNPIVYVLLQVIESNTKFLSITIN